MERILTGQFLKDWIIWASGSLVFAVPFFIYVENTTKREGGVNAEIYAPDLTNPDLKALWVERFTYFSILYWMSYIFAFVIYLAVKTFRPDLKYNSATPPTPFILSEAL